MPHVIVKLFPGRSEAQKAEIAAAVTQAVIASAGCAERAVSVSIEDVEPAAWLETVYKPDIAAQWDKVYKKPGYDPLECKTQVYSLSARPAFLTCQTVNTKEF